MARDSGVRGQSTQARQQSVVGTLAIIAGLWIFVKVVMAGIASAFLT